MLGTPSPAAAGEGWGEGTPGIALREQRPDGRGDPLLNPLRKGEGIPAYLPLFLLLPLAAFALAPLVAGPMFASADGLLHLYRLVEFDAALRSGILYPRWAPDLLAGYGYPIFIFYAPGLYYLAELFHLLGLGFADALKAAVGAGMLASGLGMYVLGRELWGRWGGLLAAVAYFYAPYRLVNTYLDGELAQTLAWAWLPWLVWACWRFLRSGRLAYGVLAAVCFAGLIATHSVSAWLATLFLGLGLLALLVRGARLSDELRLGGFLALGAGLAAPYWLPALAEQAYVQLDRVRIATYDFHTNLLPLDRTLSTALAHQYGDYVGVNGPAQLGLIQTLVAAAGVGLLLTRRRAVGLLLVGPVVVAFVLMLKPAAPFWEHIPFGMFLQFPDRLLAVMAFCLALLAGSLAKRSWLALGIGGLLIYGAAAKLQVNYVALPPSLGPLEVAAYEQISSAFGTTAKGEFTPRWLGAPPLTTPMLHAQLTGELPAWSSGPADVKLTRREPEALEVLVSAREPALIELPVAYFPGWSATASGRSVPVRPGPHGLAAVELPAGQSQIELRFGASDDRRLADAIGLLSALSLLPLLLRSRPRASLQGLKIAALAAGGGLLALALALAPGKLQLQNWPASRPELSGYAGWLQFMGGDVDFSGDRLRVGTVFRTGAAHSARAVTVTVRLMTKETVWASQTQVMPLDGWTTAVPRRADFDVPLPAGTPAGIYTVAVEVFFDGGVKQPDWTELSYEAPRVGPVTLGAVTIPRSVPGNSSGLTPANSDFGPYRLIAWQPPQSAQAGQFVPVDLWWRPAAATDRELGISLHVVDGQGKVWAGHDDQPRLGYNPTSLWPVDQLERDVQMILLPHDMPPGEYSVLAGWYDAVTKAPVGPQSVPIGRLAVTPRTPAPA